MKAPRACTGTCCWNRRPLKPGPCRNRPSRAWKWSSCAGRPSPALFLDYEGPIAGDRGSVTAWDRGTYLCRRQTQTEWASSFAAEGSAAWRPSANCPAPPTNGSSAWNRGTCLCPATAPFPSSPRRGVRRRRVAGSRCERACDVARNGRQGDPQHRIAVGLPPLRAKFAALQGLLNAVEHLLQRQGQQARPRLCESAAPARRARARKARRSASKR